ncbi:hypothetical protein EST38_g7462 [Candolleomyces aberdarensis]|uniref:Nephrocystin 3-like N-terminal domain-containing protein n=1 Tax=Candolleomyces aberdarensis TaxID=2316362 RepID=A0A4Q2DIE2_9AGAR|nr:hypothetical protein EST38_g7462 [Candolleomyces aberdarensis]
MTLGGYLRGFLGGKNSRLKYVEELDGRNKKTEGALTPVLAEDHLSARELNKVDFMRDRLEYSRSQITKAQVKDKTTKSIIWTNTYEKNTYQYEQYARTTCHRLGKKALQAQMRAKREAQILHKTAEASSSSPVKAQLIRQSVSLDADPYPEPTNVYWTQFSRLHSESTYATFNYETCPKSWLPRVRIAIEQSLNSIIDWISKVDRDSSIFWLWQESDSCREDVLRYIATRFEEEGALASAFFFPESVNVFNFPRNQFAPVLAHELTMYLPSFDRALQKSCAKYGGQFFGRSILTQVKHLIVQTFQALPPEERRVPLMIVIDGLDRCTWKHTHDILEAIQYCLKHLPVCFVISSKRTAWLEGKLKGLPLQSCIVEGLYEIPPDPLDCLEKSKDSPLPQSEN